MLLEETRCTSRLKRRSLHLPHVSGFLFTTWRTDRGWLVERWQRVPERIADVVEVEHASVCRRSLRDDDLDAFAWCCACESKKIGYRGPRPLQRACFACNLTGEMKADTTAQNECSVNSWRYLIETHDGNDVNPAWNTSWNARWCFKVARHVIGRLFPSLPKDTRLRNEFNFSCETDWNACVS